MARPWIGGVPPLAALISGCITTPAAETGWTGRARALSPGACADAALIDDLEDGNTRVLQNLGRGGYWYTFADAEGSTLSPTPFTISAGGHAGSRGAARMHGTTAGSGASIYAGIGLVLTDPRGPYDASRYRGITFLAKGPAHVRLEVPDGYTAPEAGRCKDCYNDFGIELALTDRWERYTVPFEWLSQRPGWGDPRGAIEPRELLAIEWQFGSPGRSYDVWIDDVAFFCGEAP